MREIDVNRVEDAVCRMVQQINYEYPADIEQDMKAMAAAETHPIARSTLDLLLENAHIAREEHIPICQFGVEDGRGIVLCVDARKQRIADH